MPAPARSAADLGPEDGRALLRAWLDAVDLRLSERDLLALLQSDGFSHAALERRARRCHERALERAVARAIAAPAQLDAAAADVFTACVAAIPYAPAAAFLGREKRKLAARDDEPLRVALVADGIGAMHGVTHTLDEIRERGVPGFDVEVIGTDPHVDRRLSAVAEVEIPFYRRAAGRRAVAAGGRRRARRGPLRRGARLRARPGGRRRRADRAVLGLPIAGSYHTELAAYAALRSGDDGARRGGRGRARRVLRRLRRGALAVGGVATRGSPRSASTRAVGRWDRGVDVARFSPALRDPGALDGRVRVLYAGRLTKEKGADLLADAFLAARARDPRLSSCSPAAAPRRTRCAPGWARAATFLGWLEGDALARAYADADLFLFCSQTDTFGQVLLEAQASGLPVVAVDAGGPSELIDSGRTGILCPRARQRARRRRRRPRRLAPRPRAPRPRRPGRRARTHLGGLPRRPRRRLDASPRHPCASRSDDARAAA